MVNNKYFPSDYEEFIYVSRYSKWVEEWNRRERWEETVSRYITQITKTINSQGSNVSKELLYRIKESILNFRVVPSMRALMTSGKALDRDSTCGYNCAYSPVDDVKVFDEAMFILLCGTGMGFSVENKYINKLPTIPDKIFDSDTIIVVKDSKEGWAKAYRQVLALLYSGEIPKWDVSKVRPQGSKLKIFGGRASGPEPLVSLFKFTVQTFKNAIGRKLNSLECHSLMCKIGEIVVSGGVRRSAEISLSDLNDDDMRHAKSGAWYLPEAKPYLALANNSAIYNEKPSSSVFMKEWLALMESGSGERGIINRLSLQKQASRNGRRDSSYEFGVNPCAEIILRPYQFCNLSECIIRREDSLPTILDKIEVATIIGTIQSCWTNFPYLRKQWKNNCEEERLLGVSLTGVMDNPILNGKDGIKVLRSALSSMKQKAIDVNKIWAKALGIPQSTAITTVKPSGTVSQLCNTSSGIHTRYAPYYIRTVRADKKDPLTTFMIDQGIPYEDCVMKPDTTVVFSFPHKSPKKAVFRDDLDAIGQLEMWMEYQEYYTEHKPSVTISVKDEEWLEVGAFVYKNLDKMSGVSFLPYSDFVYEQAPYQECTEKEYNDMLKQMPKKISWDGLVKYESEDTTKSSQEIACSGGTCEVVDIAS